MHMKIILLFAQILCIGSFAFQSRTCTERSVASLGISYRSTRREPTAYYTTSSWSRKSGPVQFRLSSSSDSNNDSSPSPRRWRNPFVVVLKKLLAFQLKIKTQFKKLSKRGKQIVLAQTLLFALVFGGITKTAIRQRLPPPPIEIAYSNFLELVEQQQRAGRGASSLPVLDNVRIGRDKIVYRLYRNNAEQSASIKKLSAMPPAPSPSKLTLFRSQLQRSKLQKQVQRPFLSAYTRKVPATPELVDALRKNDVAFSAALQPKGSVVGLAARTFLLGFYCLILFRFYRAIGSMGAGGGGAASQDTPGKLAQASELPLVNFNDIQGIDQAKNEVMELVDALRNPDKYAILGARAPTGLLLEGPPGTGKTMLARATAATAGVPLLYCSGSDFVEMFVGRGAARVRNLFEKAQKMAPCIVFVDELDALGKARDSLGPGGVSFGRSNDEAEQTLNQLLACMDGLDSSRRICVLAATNRKEVLDPALIRPGRFDRIVNLELPNASGRERILRVHCNKLPGFTEGIGVDPKRPNSLGIGDAIDLSAIAAVTSGLSGAELEFLVNEAAIRAVRRVSSALQKGADPKSIPPNVEAEDFEASLTNFYETRRSSKNGMVNDILKNVWKGS